MAKPPAASRNETLSPDASQASNSQVGAGATSGEGAQTDAAAITTQQLTGLTSTQLDALTTAGLSALSTAQIGSLTSAQLGTLSTTEIQDLSADEAGAASDGAEGGAPKQPDADPEPEDDAAPRPVPQRPLSITEMLTVALKTPGISDADASDLAQLQFRFIELKSAITRVTLRTAPEVDAVLNQIASQI